MAKELVFVKIGGGSITDTAQQQVAKPEVIERLLREIHRACEESNFDVIIGHGSGSFGHVVAHRYQVNHGLINDQSRIGASLTIKAAHDLDQIVIGVGTMIDMPLFPFAASSFSIANDERITDGFVGGIAKAIELGFIPVIFGDVMIDTKQGVSIASTEEIFRFVAGELKPTRVVFGTDVDGLYDKNPIENHDAQLVRKIDVSGDAEQMELSLMGAGGAKKTDVTGGMKSKIALLCSIVLETGATGYLVNVQAENRLWHLLRGDNVICTVVSKTR